MIHLLYSADYELFLGGIDQPEEAVLIEPTARLLACCTRIGIPLTLFADVACLWRYRALGLDRFPDLAEAQLVEAIQNGHDVQSHLHPHWETTRIEAGRFHFDPSSYLCGTCSPDPEARRRRTTAWLRRAATHLTELLTPHAPDYRCIAFRAGGYGLQPDEAMLLAALHETGHRIDSSIIPGFTLHTPMQRVDFTRLPAHGNGWIAPRTGLNKPAPRGEGLMEIPIGACRFTPRHRLALRLPEALRQGWEILLNRSGPAARGTPCNEPIATTSSAGRIKRAWWRFNTVLARDFQRLELGTDPRPLLACFEDHLRASGYREGQEDPLFVAMNIHPKGIHAGHLAALERFHDRVWRRHAGEIRTLTFQQAWRLVEAGIPTENGVRISVHGEPGAGQGSKA
ncbi:hypothetical protein SIID45300_00501 [Candidatus Magnetaquicoccaceae bacterium FCR-1]|uniref:NodB homology domain-containing protein n=1 Tax=Candidatus Magnetaquiglobus chichijimensis TaxID=3141448 RepID=A0ABQ0C5N3_9PROT